MSALSTQVPTLIHSSTFEEVAVFPSYSRTTAVVQKSEVRHTQLAPSIIHTVCALMLYDLSWHINSTFEQNNVDMQSSKWVIM